MGRPPTTEELGNLLGSWLEEEMFYRKAVALELDKGDAIVRRRLVQKLTFIAEQRAASDPSSDELRAWFEAESDRYRLPERVSFEQLRVPEGASPEFLQQEIANGADWRTLAAPSMQNPAYALLSMREVAAIFGDEFAAALFDVGSIAAWEGPVESEFGRHLVRITERREPELPALAAVRGRVLNDYVQSVRATARQDYLEELQNEFEVEWRVSK